MATLLRWLGATTVGARPRPNGSRWRKNVNCNWPNVIRVAHVLHDSIGHTLTAATIQAAVAGEVLASDPAAARAAMRSIEESTRAALEDPGLRTGCTSRGEAWGCTFSDAVGLACVN